MRGAVAQFDLRRRRYRFLRDVQEQVVLDNKDRTGKEASLEKMGWDLSWISGETYR